MGVLIKAGVTFQARETLYKAVVQEVLLYRSDSLVISESMMKVLDVLHH